MKKCSVCDKPALARGLCTNHYMRKRRAGELVAAKKETDMEYIINRVMIDERGHWMWKQSTREGYGRLVRNRRGYQAHVFSYTAFRGVPPDGAQVNHLCHERGCVNPAHLYAGSQKENMRDMREAGRGKILRGSENGMSKLTEKQVREILRTPGHAKPIAKRFGVSRSLIYAIRKGACWAHLRGYEE